MHPGEHAHSLGNESAWLKYLNLCANSIEWWQLLLDRRSERPYCNIVGADMAFRQNWILLGPRWNALFLIGRLYAHGEAGEDTSELYTDGRSEPNSSYRPGENEVVICVPARNLTRVGVR